VGRPTLHHFVDLWIQTYTEPGSVKIWNTRHKISVDIGPTDIFYSVTVNLSPGRLSKTRSSDAQSSTDRQTDTHARTHLADVMEVAVCRPAHSLHFVEFVEQLVRVELGRQEGESLVTERLPEISVIVCIYSVTLLVLRFAAAGPRLWNSLSLPVQLRNLDITHGLFRRQLKRHLFFGKHERGAL